MLPKVVRNVFTVGGLTAFSRVLGLVREMLQSRLIGAGIEQSAFTLAFALPNMARKLFGEGALTAAFVPVFKGEVERGEVESARRLARAVITLVMLILGSAVVLVLVGLSVWQDLRPEAGDGTLTRAELTVKLVKILFPYVIFICGAAFGMGVLNALGRFVEGAFMPAFLNIVWIAALAALCFFPGLAVSTRIQVVSLAILLGGVAQMAFLFRCMRKRGLSGLISLRGLRGSWRDEKFRLVWQNTALAAVGAGAVQVNYLLDQVLGQCAAPWAAGVIGYAERLMDLPLGVVGVAFGTVLLPTFSGHFAKGDAAGAGACLKKSLLQMTALMLPASVVTFFCAPWIVWLIYEGNAFDATATVRVARALSVYGLGLCFFAAQKCLIPFFQAQGDMKTPLRVSAETVVLNAVLNVLAVVFLPVEWRHVGLAGSTSLCSLVGCLLFLRALRAFRLPSARKM